MGSQDHAGGPSIIIVPARAGFDACEAICAARSADGAKKRRPKFDTIAAGSYGSHRNYLLGGGGRAQDKERDETLGELSRAAFRDLRAANAALATELTSSQARAAGDSRALREEVASLKSSLLAERQRVVSVEASLESEAQARRLAEERHSLQAKDCERRLEAERNKRADAEAELRQVVKKAVAYRQKVAEAETRASALSAVHANLEAERSVREELQRRLDAHEEATGRLQEQVGPLSALPSRLNQAEAAAAASSERARKLEEKLHRCQQGQSSLQETLASTQAERQALEKRVQELDQTVAANGGLEADVERLTADLDEARRKLVEQLKRAETAEGERNMRAARVAELQRTVSSQDQQLASVQQDAAAARSDADKNIARLNSELDMERETLRAMDKQVRALKEGSEQQTLRAESLNARLQETLARVDELTRQRNDMAAAAAARDEKLEECQAEHRRAQRQLAATEEEAARWRLRSNQGEALLDERDAELRKKDALVEELQQSLKVAVERLAAAQASAASDRRSADERIRALEARLQQTTIDIRELKDALAIAEQARSGLTAELARAHDDVAHMGASLADEQARCSKARAELAGIAGSQQREGESRQRMISELLAAMQAEESARIEAEKETERLRHEVIDLQGRLTASQEARDHVQEALAGTEASLGTVQRQAQTYRRENRALLSNYDSWLNSLVGQRGGLGLGFQSQPRAYTLGMSPGSVAVD